MKKRESEAKIVEHCSLAGPSILCRKEGVESVEEHFVGGLKHSGALFVGRGKHTLLEKRVKSEKKSPQRYYREKRTTCFFSNLTLYAFATSLHGCCTQVVLVSNIRVLYI